MSPATWTQVGPAPLNIDAEQIYQGVGPDSGMVTDIAIPPTGTTDQTVYIATNDGGVWKTTNAGADWTPLTDSLDSNSVGAIALDAGNSGALYVGTGNPDNNGYFRGVGIYRYDGTNWDLRGTILAGHAIYRMVSPAANVLLVGADNGLFKSVDGGLHFGDNAPNFDNGNPVIGGSSCSVDGFGIHRCITDIKVDTTSPSTIYAAVWGKGVLRSNDTGTTFPINRFLNAGAPTGLYGRISIAQSTQPDGNTMFASVANQDTGWVGLYKWSGATAAWTRQAGADAAAAAQGGCQCNYDLTVAVDPQNANRVFIGFQQPFLSTDGGGSFNVVGENVVHWDTHAMVFSPATHWGAGQTHLWLGTDGGIAESDDGTNWNNLNGAIATQLFRDIDIGRGSATNRQYTYGGAQDTGTDEHTPNSGTVWHLGIDGDGGRVAVDPSDPTHVFATDNGGFVYSTNAGGFWHCEANPDPCGYVYTWAFDPNTNSTMYTTSVLDATTLFGRFRPGSSLFQSTNSGQNFTTMHTFPSPIYSVATTKGDSKVVWVSLADGTVSRTANADQGAASDWSTATVRTAPAGGLPSAIAADPTNPSMAVVVYAGFCGCGTTNRTKHVYLTTNGGSNWTDISGTDGGAQNLADLPLHTVVIDPSTNPHTIVVGTDTGVAVSTSTGSTWQRLGTGLPTVDVTSLDIDSSINPPLLRAGTYGRSAWELTAAATPS